MFLDRVFLLKKVQNRELSSTIFQFEVLCTGKVSNRVRCLERVNQGSQWIEFYRLSGVAERITHQQVA